MTTPLPPGTIVVRGGEGPKLPPLEREIDGTPDPEIGAMMAAGASRYHLDTLREMASEDEAAKKAIAAELEHLQPVDTSGPNANVAGSATPLGNRHARRAAARRAR